MFRSKKRPSSAQSRNSLDEKVLSRNRLAAQEARAAQEREAEELRQKNAAALVELRSKIPRLLQRLDELGAPDAAVFSGHAAWKLYTYEVGYWDSDIEVSVYLLSTGELHTEGYPSGGRVSGGNNRDSSLRALEGVDRLMERYGVR